MSLEPEELLRRLRVMSELKFGEAIPTFLGSPNNWADPLAELHREALAEIMRLRKIRPAIEWMPIDTAPVPTAAELISGGSNIYTYRFRCLIQDTRGSIESGHARYAKKQGIQKAEAKHWVLRWYSSHGSWMQNPKYWMPLPLPREN